jgi:hypothetical protein
VGRIATTAPWASSGPATAMKAHCSATSDPPTPEIIRAAHDMLPNPDASVTAILPNPDASVTAIAKLLGVSPGTLYNHIPDLRELRTSRGRQIESSVKTADG